MYLSGFIPESINEGFGNRAVIFISGCKHKCKGCHSENTWDFKEGIEFTIDEQHKILDKVKRNKLLDGITICGGDPFFSAKEVVDFIKLFKCEVNNINIWTYTGFTFEQILKSNNKDMISLLNLSNVLVDGKYKEEERDLSLLFRGSNNQRIIDVESSLLENKVIFLIN